MPGRAPGMDKMFYTGRDQLPTVLDEPEPCLKQVGSQIQRVEWEQRPAARCICDTAPLQEDAFFFISLCFCRNRGLK